MYKGLDIQSYKSEHDAPMIESDDTIDDNTILRRVSSQLDSVLITRVKSEALKHKFTHKQIYT